MYLAHITLLSVLCVISEQSIFNRQNQGITDMLADMTVHPIPGTTTVVWLNENSISFVPTNYFILLSLEKIELNSNVIMDIDDSAFSGVPTVTEIWLQSNQLTVIREMMFSGLPNLATLWLSDNQIHTVEPASFRDNVALTLLHLAGNSLQNLSRCMFDLENHPTNLNTFYMHQNPLQCNQDLCWLKRLDMTWITVGWASNTECSGPAALAGRKWDTLSEQDLCDASG